MGDKDATTLEEELEESYMKKDEEGRLIPDYDRTIKVFKEGDFISGTVVRIDNNEVLVDIGYKSEGIIPLRELSIKKDVNPNDIVCLGEEIETLVLQKEDKEGQLILSKKRAKYRRAWDKIIEISEKDEKLKGNVIEVVKGGLILDIGVRGFLPASLVEKRRVKDLNDYLGCELECKVIELDRRRNNVVLSRRAVLEGSHKQERKEILSKLEKDQIVAGKISSIVDFGAFVDIGGIDGLIHISELSWDHVNHPSEVVNVGDEVKIQVLDIDKERERVSLGLKQTQKDPWRGKIKKFSEGDLVKGKIKRIVPFGAFIELSGGLEGLIHISEMAETHIDSPEQVVKVDDVVDVIISAIDTQNRKISLSLKQAKKVAKEDKPDEPEAAKEEVKEEEVKEEEVKEESPEPGSLEEVLQQMKKERSQKEK